MKITTLVENDSINNDLKAAHGLSLFIETKNLNIVMDLGPNNLYLKNAKKLDIDINDANYLIVSHGHNDHASGLKKFMRVNKHADIIASKHIFQSIVKKQGNNFINIGVKKPRKDQRLTLIDDDIELTQNVHVFCHIDFQKHPINDESLYVYEQKQYQPDHFSHEIYLVIEENDHIVLFSACSHKGIENIISSIEDKLGKHITDVIGGFHFSHYNPFDVNQTEYLQQLASSFKQENRLYYSCHCTGDDAYFELKRHLKTKLHRLKTGSVITI
ncbi:MAG: MBL fold metallo-hydrolase [Candidatus Izemoplasma sp.]|nr:MBL fold metallo-hydrolase [Candidatus Izemoplasma sp.]